MRGGCADSYEDRIACSRRAGYARASCTCPPYTPAPGAQTREDAARDGTRPPYTLWGSVRGVIAEAATPTDFDASDGDGNLLWPGFPPVVFVRMEVRPRPALPCLVLGRVARPSNGRATRPSGAICCLRPTAWAHDGQTEALRASQRPWRCSCNEWGAGSVFKAPVLTVFLARASRLQRDGADADVAQNLAFFARNGVPSDVIVVSAPAETRRDQRREAARVRCRVCSAGAGPGPPCSGRSQHAPCAVH